jgi:uncharacterized HAD superfamily protein
MRKRIGIDIDGVLANFISQFRNLNNTLHSVNITEEAKDWNFSNWGLTPEQFSMSWRHLSQTINFWVDLPVNSDIQLDDLKYLDDNYELYFITTRATSAGLPVEKQTNIWLKKQGFEHPTVIVTKEKGPVASALKLDAFIDDNYDNLLSVHIFSPYTKLFYRLSTYSVANEIGAVEVNSFNEFVTHIGSIA